MSNQFLDPVLSPDKKRIEKIKSFEKTSVMKADESSPSKVLLNKDEEYEQMANVKSMVS